MRVPKGMFRRPRRGWYCRVKVAGKDRWVSLGLELNEAVAKFYQVKGKPVLRSKVTVSELGKLWLDSYVKNARNEYNQEQTASRFERLVKPSLGVYLAGKLSGEHIRALRIQLEKTLSDQSVVHALSDVRCLLRWAEEAGYIERSPFPRKIMPKIQERPPDRLTNQELEKVINVRDPFGFICRFLVYTGLRWGEANRAVVSDLKGGVLLVHKTKSGKVRRIPVPNFILHGMPEVGRIIPLNSLTYVTKIIRDESEVKEFHLHQLRHTFACRFLEAGGSLEALRQVLGHSTIRTTERYARISDDLVLKEAKRVAKLVATG